MQNTTNNRTSQVPPWLEIVRRKIAAIDFGLVQIVVHDGRVVQIECTEKTRLPADQPRDALNGTR